MICTFISIHTNNVEDEISKVNLQTEICDFANSKNVSK